MKCAQNNEKTADNIKILVVEAVVTVFVGTPVNQKEGYKQPDEYE